MTLNYVHLENVDYDSILLQSSNLLHIEYLDSVPDIWKTMLQGHLLLTWINFNPRIPARINNYVYYKVWDETTSPFLNFNGATIEVENG